MHEHIRVWFENILHFIEKKDGARALWYLEKNLTFMLDESQRMDGFSLHMDRMLEEELGCKVVKTNKMPESNIHTHKDLLLSFRELRKNGNSLLHSAAQYGMTGICDFLIKKGDIAIALSSSGIHSNGFSMVRSILKDNNISLYDTDPFEKSKTIGETLLEPTKIYTKFLNKLNTLNLIKRSVNVTGGGLIKNPPRVFDDNLSLKINVNNWHLPKEFKWLKKKGNLSTFEMLKVFNCGIGMILIIKRKDLEKFSTFSKKIKQPIKVLGKITNQKNVIFI